MNDREIQKVNDLLAEINARDLSKLPRHFLCDACDRAAEHYMVHAHIWAEAHDGKAERGLLCIDCLSEKLGRPIGPYDLKPAPINKSLLTGMLLAS